jgi:hypothetical protein
MTKSIDPDELLTVTQAAAERGTTRQAINYLIRHGKLEVVEIAGKRFVSRRILASFTPAPGGRPPKSKAGIGPALKRERGAKSKRPGQQSSMKKRGKDQALN